jgi:hypothetical protein
MRTVRLAAIPISALALAALTVGCDAGRESADTSSKGPTLTITQPRMDQVLGDPNDKAEKTKVEVVLDLRDYEIGKVDDGKNGQHVHLIVDDEPYQAIYDASKAIPLQLGAGTHVLRAFPSAGPKDPKGALHHESRKNAGAFAWVRFHVKRKGDDPDVLAFDATKNPTLTYSRPKGDYKVGQPELARFLLDFYVTGTSLSPTGAHVRATLDGNPVVDAATKKPLGDVAEWTRYVIESPAVGDHEMRLELVDREGRPIPGPYNDTRRKFRVLEK